MKLLPIVTIFVYALKIIGLAPFSRHSKISPKNIRNANCNDSGNGVFRFSRIGLAYNILLLIIFQILVVLAVPHLFSLNFPNNSSVSIVLDLVEAIAYYITVNAIMISWTLRQKEAVCVVNELVEIDHVLSGIEGKSLFSKKVLALLMVEMVFNGFLLISLNTTEVLLFHGTFIIWLVTCASTIVTYSFIVEYFLVVRLLVMNLKRVNKNLSKLDKVPNRLHPASIFNDYNLPVLGMSNRDQLATLKLLGMVRSRLTNLSQNVADFFSFPILITIGCIFFVLVYNFYFLISPVFHPRGYLDFSIDYVFDNLLWIMMNVYPLAVLSINVTRAGNEAKLTGRIVRKLMTKPMRREIKLMLKQLSLQLIHEKVGFTANGFFVLDCTMLHSILGAVTTYLVILIQFNLANNNASQA